MISDQTFYRKEPKLNGPQNLEPPRIEVSLDDIGFPEVEISDEELLELSKKEELLQETEEREESLAQKMLPEEASQKTPEVRFKEYWAEIDELLNSADYVFLDNIFPNPLDKDDDLIASFNDEYNDKNFGRFLRTPELLGTYILAHQEWTKALSQYARKIFVPSEVITQIVNGNWALKHYFKGHESRKALECSSQGLCRYVRDEESKKILGCCESLEALVMYLQENQTNLNNEIIPVNQNSYRKIIREVIGLAKTHHLCDEHLNQKNYADIILVASAIYHSHKSGSPSLILTNDKKHIPPITDYCLKNLVLDEHTAVRVVVPGGI